MGSLDFIEAVKAGQFANVESLIRSGAQIDQQDEQGWTALSFAAGSGELTLVRLLVESGADICIAGRDMMTPYRIALCAGHISVAHYLRDVQKASGRPMSDHGNLKYCKAYPLSKLKQFIGWPDGNTTNPTSGKILDDSAIVYIHPDFTVTESWQFEQVIYRNDDQSWKEFCTNTLKFNVPDELELTASAKAGD